MNPLLLFLNMSRTITFSFKTITEIGAATLGLDLFFSLLTLSFIIVGYASSKDKFGQYNLATIPVFSLLACVLFSLFIPPATSLIIWILGIFLSGGSILWKVAIKRKGET